MRRGLKSKEDGGESEFTKVCPIVGKIDVRGERICGGSQNKSWKALRHALLIGLK